MEKLTSLLILQDDEQHEETHEVRLNLGWVFSVIEKLTLFFLRRIQGKRYSL